MDRHARRRDLSYTLFWRRRNKLVWNLLLNEVTSKSKAMGMLKDFVRFIFGIEESEPVSVMAVWVVVGFLLFLVFVLRSTN